MAKLLSWRDTVKVIDGYELVQILHVYSESEGTRATGSFTVTVYMHASGAVLYIRADPDGPVDHCLVANELESILPADAEPGESFDEAFVKVLAEGEKRGRELVEKLDKPPEPQGESN